MATTNPNYELAGEKLCRFVRKLRDLLSSQQFDLILAGGNSGMVTSCIAGGVFEALSLPVPRMILVPFFRFEPGHEHDEAYRVHMDVFLPDVEEQLRVSNQRPISRVLFVDDEMGPGKTMEAVLCLVKKALGGSDQIAECVAVVERHPGHTEPPTQIGGTRVIVDQYDGFSGVIGAMMYLVEPDANHTGGIKETFCRKLGASIKDFNGGSPKWRATDEPDKAFVSELKEKIKTCLS